MSGGADLDGQLEKGGLFTHTALSVQAERINRVEAFVYGLADALLESGQVTEEELRTRTENVAKELKERGETLSGGVALRVDPEPPAADATVDCAARMHVCQAVCCRLSFPLSAPEVEGRRIKWELGMPYFARKDDTGSCVHQDENKGCGIYQDRPRVCRTYSCANDERIWSDFDGMVLNQEWIDENLGPHRPRLVATQMDRVE